MSVVRARVALALAYLCMQCMTRVYVEMNCKEISFLLLRLIRMQPMCSYITCILPYLVVRTRMLFVCTCILLVYTRILLVCNFSHDHIENYGNARIPGKGQDSMSH